MIDSSTPNQPIQNYEIVNPGLEQQVASLLPSVAGYGGNLRATNTIIPIVDLTAAAEGSNVPESLQQAIAFGSQTVFDVFNTTTSIITTTGFWRITGSFWSRGDSTPSNTIANIQMSDGLTTKIVFGIEGNTGGSTDNVILPFDLVIFSDSGITTSIACGGVATAIGSVRQVASKDGTLVTPSGF
tara:strand:- start:1127 stop:1681 length:555 start_codon:yes stop_codon:yes gene_type:complete